MPFCASARFPASPLPGFPAFRLPASQLFCFPAFWLPPPLFLLPFLLPLLPLRPSFSSVCGLCRSLRFSVRFGWNGVGEVHARMPFGLCLPFFGGGGFADTPGSARFGWNGEGEALSPDAVWLLSVVGALCGHPGSCTSGRGGGALTGFRCELRRGSARRPWRDFGASRGVVPFGGWRGYGDGTTGHEKKRRPQCGERRLRFALYRSGRAKRPFGSSPEWGGRPPGRVGLSVWASGCGAFQRPGRAQTWRRDRRT